MRKECFTYSVKVTGLDRKQVASTIAETLGGQVKYQGPPSFNYEVSGWTIDRDSVVKTPELEDRESLRKVFEALDKGGAVANGDGTITLSMDGHNGNTLRNLANLIWAKQDLVQRALGRETDILPESLVDTINAVPIDSIEDFATVINSAIDSGEIQGDSELDFDLAEKTISFSFFNGSLNLDEVGAFATLCQQLNKQAQKQKFSSTKQKEVANDKYAMRCFLLKLGFIGDVFKTDRKILLNRLGGNSAFRTEDAQLAAKEKLKGQS